MNLTPEERAKLDLASQLQTTILRTKAEVLVRGALIGIDTIGVGCSMMIGARSSETPEMAAYVVVATGKYTAEDLDRIKRFMLGAAQDATVGMETKTVQNGFQPPQGGPQGGSDDGS